MEDLVKRPRLLSYMSTIIMIGTSALRNNAMNTIRATSVVSNVNGEIPLLIGTHDGSFHCDEALAIGMLKCLPKYASATVLRTRKPELLSQCEIVVDVGAIYDPSIHRYDHHQRGFEHFFDGYKTKLSSAGLIYKHFGHQILSQVAQSITNDEMERMKLIDVSYNKIYKNFMEHIDAIDNGISICDTAPKYHISTTLSTRVGTLNPAWNEESTTEIQNARFIDAMTLTCTEFLSEVESLMKVWWPARSIVQDALKNRYHIHTSGKIVVLNQYCPWKDHIFELEKEENVETPVLYALYEDSNGSWRIQAVPIDPDSFHSRKKLPAEWCGLRDEQLSEKTGVPGAIFIHAGGFIGGHSTKEGALELAIKVNKETVRFYEENEL